MCNWLLYLKQKVQQLLANTALNKYYFTRYDMILYDTKWYFFIYLFFFSFVHFLSGLFTYYLCWIYVLDVRINIIIIREILWNRKHTKFQQSDVVSTRSDLTLSNATTEWINGLGQSLTWLRRASFTTEWRDTMVYYKRTPSPSLN